MRTWFENEAILQRVRDLLGRTEEEMHRLSETASPEGVPGAEELPAVGLLQLMEAFTALRHELKLQTKSGRSLEEAVRAALEGLDRAVEHLRSVQSREEAAVAEAALPLVLALIELDEALERGERAFLLLEQQVMQDATQELDETLEQAFAQRSAWQRWRARPWHAFVRATCHQHLTDLSQRLLTPLREGYEMIRARLQRLLELVDQLDLPPETVVEELRPGYRWRGRIVRFAEVRAVCRRPLPAAAQESEGEEGPWT